MGCRMFEITLISANDLEVVRKVFKMEVHARVSIGSTPEKRTPTDKHGETNPAWNFTMNYTISESMVQNFNNMVVIKLYCTRMFGDKYIGEVHTSIKELFDLAYPNGGCAVVSFPVLKGSVNSHGGLKLSYKFGERVINF
ncbi:Uncharacterized protein Fot_54604 [Forsythia ovata]|uniref:C2 domain-containing protein n=1 Tax=Forsythia ovata TaxID=205694 RepID=A0ABD1P7K1_9LAMI